MMDSNLEDNSGSASGFGGAVYNSGTLSMTNSALTQNFANYGGGIHNTFRASTTLTTCTLSENTASGGGGIDNNQGSIIIINSTFSTNLGSSQGGAILNSSDGSVEVAGSTFVNNSAGTWGGGGSKILAATLWSTAPLRGT